MARTRTPKIPGETPAEPAQDNHAEAANLPDQDEIDSSSITQPVLSRQGWVLPKPKTGG